MQGAVLDHKQVWENKLVRTSSSGKGFGVTVVCKLNMTLQFLNYCKKNRSHAGLYSKMTVV